MVSVRVWVEKGDLGLATEEMMKGKGAQCMDIESLNTYCLQPIFRNSSEGDMGNPARSVGGRKKPAKMIDTARPCTITRYVLNFFLTHHRSANTRLLGAVSYVRINPLAANHKPNNTEEHR